GRTFKESLQKALRSLEIKRFGLIGDGADQTADDETLTTKLSVPNAERSFWLGQAFARGWDVERVFELTKIDPWFLRQIEEIVLAQAALPTSKLASVAESAKLVGRQIRGEKHGEPCGEDMSKALDQLRRAKRLGFSDRQLTVATATTEATVRDLRAYFGITPTYRLVDTCAAEFEAFTPY